MPTQESTKKDYQKNIDQINTFLMRKGVRVSVYTDPSLWPADETETLAPKGLLHHYHSIPVTGYDEARAFAEYFPPLIHTLLVGLSLLKTGKEAEFRGYFHRIDDVVHNTIDEYLTDFLAHIEPHLCLAFLSTEVEEIARHLEHILLTCRKMYWYKNVAVETDSSLPSEARYVVGKKLAGSAESCVYLAWDIKIGRYVILKTYAGPTSAEKERRIIAEALTATIASEWSDPYRLPPPIDMIRAHLPQKMVEEKAVASADHNPSNLGEKRTIIVYTYHEGLRAPMVEDNQDIRQKRESLLSFLTMAAKLFEGSRRIAQHRDIKPKNLLMGPEGRPVLIDWGIASTVLPDINDSVHGTLGCLPIRLLQREYEKEEMEDHQRDLYAFALVAWQMIVRAALYEDTPDIIKHIEEKTLVFENETAWKEKSQPLSQALESGFGIRNHSIRVKIADLFAEALMLPHRLSNTEDIENPIHSIADFVSRLQRLMGNDGEKQ